LIQQVLLNLCVNARDAMPNGGRLSLRMDNVTLDGNCMHRNIDAKPGNYVVIEVTDNGTGIKKEIQDKLFEPFFTTKEVGKGTGLGLSTSLGIVRSHGGFITCYSEPGNGSTFNVYLPAVPGPDAVESVPRTNTPVLRGQNELVLVVDDEQAIRVCVQQTLEDSGYRVLTAANGAEALSLYSSWQKEIAIVLIDMTMPVMDGPTAIAALKSLNPRIRIIGASGLNATGNHYETVKESIIDFIPKPYLPGILVQAMHHALQFDASEAGPNHEKPSPELLKNN
jgi:CheY-like chemotaxis protein